MRKFKCPQLGILFLAFFALVDWPGNAYGQVVTGRLMGAITDSSGAAVPGAEVTITSQGTGVVWHLKTDSLGNYVAPSLPPGNYNLQVEASGFRTALSTGVVIEAEQTARLDVTMQVGTLNQSVEVTASAPLVQSETSGLGEVVGRTQVETLPLNGRIFSQLVDLVPGAVGAGWADEPESAGGAGARSYIMASINGLPWSGTVFNLDGVNNMETMNAFTNVAPPLEAIEEFKVVTNNPSAEFGTFGGAAVNVTMRSGTNDFHGSLFEYLRNDDLNSRNFFSAGTPPFKSNEFGATFGGPFKKNKAFFFGDYQGLRMRFGETFLDTVPTQDMRNGIFSPEAGFATIYDPTTQQPFPNNTIPSSRFDAVDAVVANIWPLPNLPGITNNFLTNAVKQEDTNNFDIKGDYVISDKDRFFVRESYDWRNLLAPLPAGNRFMMTADVNSYNRQHNAAFGETHNFSPTLLNEFRIGFNRFNTHDNGNDYPVLENNILGIPNGNIIGYPGTYGMASFYIGDIWATGSPGWTNAHRMENLYQIADDLSWVKGRNTTKFGVNYMYMVQSLTNGGNQRGYFNFDAGNTSLQGSGGDPFASFLLGDVESYGRDIVNTDPAVLQHDIAMFAQDDIRVTRKLTLNIGLRWEDFLHPSERHNRQGNFDLSTGLIDLATSGNTAPNVNNFTTAFSPRLGLAYSPDNGRTAIRGAFGLSYFYDNWGGTGGTLEFAYPFDESASFAEPTLYTPFATVAADGLPYLAIGHPSGTSIAPPNGAGVTYMPQDFQPDGVVMWNFGVQRQLSSTTALEVTYVGTHGDHLFRGGWPIDIPLAPGPAPIPQSYKYYYLAPEVSSIGRSSSDGDSHYNGLEVKFTKRFSHGLQGLTSYTWSKCTDDMTFFWTWDDKMNRAPCSNKSYNTPQNLVISGTYELPFGKGRSYLAKASRGVDAVAGGWSLNAIMMFHSGQPLTMSVSPDELNTNTGNHPDLTCSKVGLIKNVNEWFDTNCFSVPAAYTFGNAGGGIVEGPGVANFDLSLFKKFAVTESQALEIRGEFFNAFNNPHFGNPATTLGYSNFGVISSTILTPREIQIGLKYTF